jgi:hypothetical protein
MCSTGVNASISSLPERWASSSKCGSASS